MDCFGTGFIAQGTCPTDSGVISLVILKVSPFLPKIVIDRSVFMDIIEAK